MFQLLSSWNNDISFEDRHWEQTMFGGPLLGIDIGQDAMLLVPARKARHLGECEWLVVLDAIEVLYYIYLQLLHSSRLKEGQHPPHVISVKRREPSRAAPVYLYLLTIITTTFATKRIISTL